MGEIANDIMEGRCCSQCGEYFQDPEEERKLYEHGYPVLCDWCWVPGLDIQKAKVETI